MMNDELRNALTINIHRSKLLDKPYRIGEIFDKRRLAFSSC